MTLVLSAIGICALWFVAGFLVGRGPRRKDAKVRESSQVRHVDPSAKTPVDRPRVKDPSGR
jgi:hypothetical protein